jgi:proteasome alpha subunit
MMLDEPYRWAEAVANRRDYIEDQLRNGSPLVGTGFQDGSLLITLGQGQQKIFEVYDRVALAAVGHPTDIEKLRQSAIDLAHVIGFNYSKSDVTLQQIVHFGLGPAMKTAFDEIVRSPFVARLLLAELNADGQGTTFYTVDYDGGFHTSPTAVGVGGIPEADQLMTQSLQGKGKSSEEGGAVFERTLQEALQAGLRSWAIGRWVGGLTDTTYEPGVLEETLVEADIDGLLKREMETLTPEVVVLDKASLGGNTFRRIPADEVMALVEGMF